MLSSVLSMGPISHPFQNIQKQNGRAGLQTINQPGWKINHRGRGLISGGIWCKGQPYITTKTSISHPVTGSCLELVCLHGATCKEKDDDGLLAQCVCDFQCSSVRGMDNQSVCGSDGNTYGSECQMRLFSCRYQKPISVANEGPCKRGGGQIEDQSPTPGPVRRSTVHRSAAASLPETKSTREIVLSQPDSFHLTTRPTLATPTATDDSVKIPSFFGHSFLELPRLQAYARLSLELEFLTFTKDGIILYNGQNNDGVGDFVALVLKDGFVEFRYDLGNGPVILRSPQKLHLGKFHRLVAKRYLKEGLLALDGQEDVAGRSQGFLKSLDLSQNLFIGYIPNARRRIFDNVAVKIGFVGCIRRLKIGKKEIDLRYPTSRDIVRGRNIGECGSSPCTTVPCKNSGICEHLSEDDYRCSCQPGYTGKTCDTFNDPCLNNPCSRGATYQTKEGNHFVCKCPPGTAGDYCEIEKPEIENAFIESEIFIPEFDGQSYLEFSTLTNVRHSFNIELWFLTRAPGGTLLYNGQKKDGRGDFVALTLSEGHLFFTFDLGSADPTVSGVVNIKSLEAISLNEWHIVKVYRSGKSGSLQVDEGAMLTAETTTSLTELNLELNLYVGGVPSLEEVNSEAMIRSGLNGAIQRVVVNGETWSDLLSSATWSHGVRRYRGPPGGGPDERETAKQCLNGGLCVPRLNKVTCKCQLHYWGTFCERRITKEDLEKPVSFNGKRSLNFPSRVSTVTEGQRETNIEITFRTKSANGLLLWTQGGSAANVRGGDYLALAVAHGKVQLSFNLGKQTGLPLLIVSDRNVNDQEWHTALVERSMRVGTLIVDDSEPVTNTSAVGATELNTDGVYWIGGFPNLPADLPKGFYDGFEGCIERVVIDGDPLRLLLHTDGDEVTFCDDF